MSRTCPPTAATSIYFCHIVYEFRTERAHVINCRPTLLKNLRPLTYGTKFRSRENDKRARSYTIGTRAIDRYLTRIISDDQSPLNLRRARLPSIGVTSRVFIRLSLRYTNVTKFARIQTVPVRRSRRLHSGNLIINHIFRRKIHLLQQ